MDIEVTVATIRTIGTRLYGNKERGPGSWHKPMKVLMHLGDRQFRRILKGEEKLTDRRKEQLAALYKAILVDPERRVA